MLQSIGLQKLQKGCEERGLREKCIYGLWGVLRSAHDNMVVRVFVCVCVCV